MCCRTGLVWQLTSDVAQFDVRGLALPSQARGLGGQRRGRFVRRRQHAAVIDERQGAEELAEQPALERDQRQDADDAARVASGQVERLVPEDGPEDVAPVPGVVGGGLGMRRHEGIPVGAGGFNRDGDGHEVWRGHVVPRWRSALG